MSATKNLSVSVLYHELGAVARTIKGKKPSNSGPADPVRIVPYINIKAFESGVADQFAEPGPYPECEETDVLIVWDGARAGLVGTGARGYIGSTLAKISVPDVTDKYLFYFLQSNYHELNSRTKGVGIPHIDPLILNGLSIPIPSEEQQDQAVAHLDLQLSRLDAAVAALKRAQANLKRYRASVLQAAVTGRLVPTEHELAQAEGREYETGEQLRERILAERRRSWSGKGKYKEPSATEDVWNPRVKGWGWGSLDQLAESQLGYMLDKAKRTEGIVLPYLRNVNVRWRHFDLTSVFNVPIKAELIERYTVRPGDLLVCEGGEPGRAAVWTSSGQVMAFQKALHRIRPFSDVSPTFIQFVLEDAANRGRLVSKFTGSTIKHLTKEALQLIGVPIPPLAEQARIVAEVERCLSVADQLEATLEANLRRATRLRQAILKKAFTFRHVQTSADPAAVGYDHRSDPAPSEARVTE